MKCRKRTNKYAGFTLLEMLLVLSIIAVLLLLFVPNLSKKSELIQKEGTEALTKVIETQSELFKLEMEDHEVTWEKLFNNGYLTQKQIEDAKKRKIQLK
ncbi:competence type IV pilus major pilin ComGC [Vagococcus entomophilus]|uniref:Competence protein ComGC n=1 Tax=Vagococcus entomophilus TaxID=1160095 RepID=A0A430AGP7_9ENTE|nr:competence type IV pilus major pilin ComGC [Vagococcus entomophilus]RSU07017.1 hypothetical protein CBF30_07090 [Vagococcus entomophilus]